MTTKSKPILLPDKDDNCGTLEYTRIENEIIIGFNLWGEKRLCLPHLLRFVLTDFDIEVIDRAVTDLKINCFNCTEDQMQLLYKNDIFTTNVMRCGLIRKSDAERLCKYVLQPNRILESVSQFNKKILRYPSINIIHMCFGQQDGVLFPVLYTSIDAKCIKCTTCENIFRTYEFVGHTHKLDEVTNTSHWGFDSNNWRLLIHLNIKTNMNHELVEKSKTILDNIKLLFYEDELNKNGKFNRAIIWRPRKQIKLKKPPVTTSSNHVPNHLNKSLNPPEVFQKTPTKISNNRNNWLNNMKCSRAPNIYLKVPKGVVYKSSNQLVQSIEDNDDDDDDDDDDDEEEETENDITNDQENKIVMKTNLEMNTKPNLSDQALNTALQIKNEIAPKDLISLGAVSLFLSSQNKTNSSIGGPSGDLNQSQHVVAPPTTVPPQYLMLEAVWTQLLREVIQMANQLVELTSANSGNNHNLSAGTAVDNKNRLVATLFRCQDIFRTQWTNLAEDNCKLKQSLLNEQTQRQKLCATINEISHEKDQLTTILKQCGQTIKQHEIALINKKEQLKQSNDRQHPSKSLKRASPSDASTSHFNGKSLVDMRSIIDMDYNESSIAAKIKKSHVSAESCLLIDCKSPSPVDSLLSSTSGSTICYGLGNTNQ